MTKSDLNDVYNLVEKATVRTLCADPWLRPSRYFLEGLSARPTVLAGAGHVESVHVKLNRDAGGAPLYTEYEVPAIGVYCTGENENEGGLGEVRVALSVALDVVAYGADAAAADRHTKEIVARARALMRGQMSAGGSMLDGFAAGGDVVLDDRTAFSVVEESGGWVAEGATGFEVVVFSEIGV